MRPDSVNALAPEDIESLRSLKAEYFYWMDTKQWDRLRALFTDEARYEGFPFSMAGPDRWVAGLRSFMAAAVSQHRGSEFRHRLCPDGRVRGVWAMTDYVTWEPGTIVYRGVPVPDMYGFRGYGYYEEEYVRDAGRWRIDFMRLTRVRIDPVVVRLPEAHYDVPAPQVDWLD